MPESVLITDTGLLLVYQPYELAPYSYGMVTVELTDEELLKQYKRDFGEKLAKAPEADAEGVGFAIAP